MNTAAAIAVLSATVIALAVRVRRLERTIDEQLLLFNGHLLAHDGLAL